LHDRLGYTAMNRYVPTSLACPSDSVGQRLRHPPAAFAPLNAPGQPPPRWRAGEGSQCCPNRMHLLRQRLGHKAASRPSSTSLARVGLEAEGCSGWRRGRRGSGTRGRSQRIRPRFSSSARSAFRAISLRGRLDGNRVLRRASARGRPPPLTQTAKAD